MFYEEIWRDIPGYEGLYEVSTKGRVRTVERTILRSNGKRYHIKQRYLAITYWGYAHVILHKDKKQRCIDVHRLVALAFIPNPENLFLVNHRDENTYNNNVENLEWCDYQYNNMYNGRSKNIGNKLKVENPGILSVLLIVVLVRSIILNQTVVMI